MRHCLERLFFRTALRIQLPHRGAHIALCRDSLHRRDEKFASETVQLLDLYLEIHIVVIRRLNPQPQFHVSGKLHIAVCLHPEDCALLFRIRVVNSAALNDSRMPAESSLRSVQIKLPAYGSHRREGVFGTVDDVFSPGIQDAHPDFRRILPSVILIHQVAVEKLSKVFDMFRIVIIVPFSGVVYPEPFIFGRDPLPAFDAAVRVNRIRVACGDIGGRDDRFEIRRFVAPVVVHQRRFIHDGHAVFDASLRSRSEGIGEELDKFRHHHTASRRDFAITVVESLPGRDRGQMFRLLRGNEPLRDREPRVSAHADLSGTPLLIRGPFDNVRTVSAIIAAEKQDDAFRIVRASDVRVDHRVAVRDPVRRIRSFEFLQTRCRVFRNSCPHRYIVKPLAADLLPIGTQRQNRGMLLIIRRTEYICIDCHVVTQSDRNVPFENDIAGKRHRSLHTDAALFKKQLFLTETRVTGGRRGDRQGLTYRNFQLRARSVMKDHPPLIC